MNENNEKFDRFVEARQRFCTAYVKKLDAERELKAAANELGNEIAKKYPNVKFPVIIRAMGIMLEKKEDGEYGVNDDVWFIE